MHTEKYSNIQTEILKIKQPKQRKAKFHAVKIIATLCQKKNYSNADLGQTTFPHQYSFL